MNRPGRGFDSRAFDPVEQIECSDERWLALQFVQQSFERAETSLEPSKKIRRPDCKCKRT